jgi:dynein heavy chain 2, cytosolic
VGSLRADNLNEIKSFTMPPDPIRDVLECVLYLMGTYNTTWKSMKKFLGISGVIKSIVNFDARMISHQVRDDVIKLMEASPSSFEQEKIYRVSVATAPLAAWVKANVKYSYALEKTQPLEEELEEKEMQLHKAKAKLTKCEDELKLLDQQVQKLKETFAECTSQAAVLKESLKRAEERLKSAQNLISKLSGEKKRWAKQMDSIDEEVKFIPTGSLLAAGFISYLGSANEAKRAEVLEEWKKALKITQFDFMKFMCNESDLLKWKGEGLPADDLSMENAIIILNNIKTSLIIDPAVQATDWLKFHLKDQGSALEVLNQQEPRFCTQLELALRFGKILILQELDSIEGILFPILRNELIHQGPRWVLQVGDKLVDYNENFQLFLTTRDSHIEIPPNAISLISVVNFTVTKSGLEGQLLSITLNHEQPELESKKTELLEKEEKLKIQLAGLEESLLSELASGEGNILENKNLIDSLNETKAKSITIEESLEESKELQHSLDQQREAYRVLANKGSILFMIISDLQKINKMYLFSLSTFIKLFKKALDSKPDGNISLLFFHLY